MPPVCVMFSDLRFPPGSCICSNYKLGFNIQQECVTQLFPILTCARAIINPLIPAVFAL